MPELAPVTMRTRSLSGIALAVFAVFVLDALRQARIVFAFIRDRGRRWDDNLASFSGELRERLRNWFRGTVAADDAEAQLVRRAIEWRQLRQSEIVIGPAPPKRAQSSARVQPIDGTAPVACHLGLVQTGEAVHAT